MTRIDCIEIELSCGNAAFCDDGGLIEVARILRNLADGLEGGFLPGVLIDKNGNRVGEVEYTLKEE